MSYSVHKIFATNSNPKLFQEIVSFFI